MYGCTGVYMYKRSPSPLLLPKDLSCRLYPALQIMDDDLDNHLFSIVYSFSVACRKQAKSQ